MITTKIIATAIMILTITTFPGFSAEDGACVKLDRTGIVGRSIWAHANRIRGTHYCESRKSFEADIDGDDIKDLFVTYVIEGPCFKDRKFRPGTCGNYHAEFLAIYLMKNEKYQKPIIVQIGGRGERSVTDISIEGNRVNLKTLEYDKDPMCCPSKPGNTTYIFKNGNVAEEK